MQQGPAPDAPPLHPPTKPFPPLDADLVREFAGRNTLAAIDAHLAGQRARWVAGEDTDQLRATLADWRAIRTARQALDTVQVGVD